MSTLKDALNLASPQQLADFFRTTKLGDIFAALPTHLHKQAPVAGAASNGNLTTLSIIKLPDYAKAAAITRATGRAGDVVDEFTPQAFGATPTTGQCAVTPCGDIAFVGTDTVTDVDALYTPMKGEALEFIGTPATGVLTLPTAWTSRGVLMLLEAEVLTGSVTGSKIVLVPLAGGGAGLPATTKAQLTSNKTTVSFNNATDAPTKVRVKCLVAPEYALSAKLGETTPY